MTPEQVNELIGLWDDSLASDGEIAGQPNDPRHRVCRVVPVPTPEWLFGLLSPHLQATVNLLRYPVGGHVGWHRDKDTRHNTDRVTTFVLGLNSDYTGGDLEVRGRRRQYVRSGEIISFPASTLHRVRPVLTGERWTAVTWEVE